MSGLSPRRLKSKTSDITDFFRSVTHSSHDVRQKGSSAMNLEVPLSDGEAVGSKKKITRIPLFGRPRKKSTHSYTSGTYPFSDTVRDSLDQGEQSSRAPSTSTERRPSVPSLINAPAPPVPPRKDTISSFGSKFAAHFSHSRSTKPAVSKDSASAQPVPGPSGLVPPSSRSASFESGSSGGSKKRSTTPRPTITVSLSRDSGDEFRDLFTKPKRSKTIGQPSTTFEPKKKAPLDDLDVTRRTSPPLNSTSPSIYKRGYTPASAIAAAVRDQQAIAPNESPPSASSKNSRKNSDPDTSHDKEDRSVTPRFSESREIPRPLSIDKEKNLPPSLHRRSSAVVTGSADLASSRVRIKPPSSPTRTPPSIPLPAPPPLTSIDIKHVKTDSMSSSEKILVRPRAHTIGSSSSILPHSRQINFSTPSPTTPVAATRPSVEPGNLDIDNATVEELRSALKARNLQYDELATFVLKMTESHMAEVTALEKKISALEKEARKRDTQIKGFTWLLNDGESPQQQPKPLPSSILNQSRFASTSRGAESDQEVRRSTISGGSRRFTYQSDSGNESHATSGGESLHASSGTESSPSNKKLKRLYLGDPTQTLVRTGSMLRSFKVPPGVGPEKAIPEAYYLANVKRSSMSSMSASPNSSTSSLLPPSPSITMSSLSAIPEGPGPTVSVRLPKETAEQFEERRALRASNRISTSSLTSSSTATSSSYSANIKRSRPTSIAQVLDKSPETFSKK